VKEDKAHLDFVSSVMPLLEKVTVVDFEKMRMSMY
jgi:hypothetical protein